MRYNLLLLLQGVTFVYMRKIKFILAFLMWFMSMFIYVPILMFIYIALIGEIETKGFWSYLKQGIDDTWDCLVKN